MQLEMESATPEEFAAMRARLPRVTTEGLFETYRISQRTWYKLRDGVPVKRKTLDQIRARYRQVAGE